MTGLSFAWSRPSAYIIGVICCLGCTGSSPQDRAISTPAESVTADSASVASTPQPDSITGSSPQANSSATSKSVGAPTADRPSPNQLQSQAEAESYLKSLGAKIQPPFRGERTISASGLGLTDADLYLFQHFTDLARLRLGHSNITGTGFKDLNCPNLRSLLLFNTGVDDEGLRQLPVLPRLELLDLSHTKITGKSLEYLASFSALEDLVLIDTAVTDESLVHLISLTKLKAVNLQDTTISDAGALALRDCASLTGIDLDGTRITDKGLAVLGQLPELMRLDLNGTAVTDIGVEQLADSAAKLLFVLRLRGTKVTQKGVSSLKRFENLTALDIRDTAISDEGLQELRKAFPNARFNEPELEDN